MLLGFGHISESFTCMKVCKFSGLFKYDFNRKIATLPSFKDSLGEELLAIKPIIIPIYYCQLKTLLVIRDKEITITRPIIAQFIHFLVLKHVPGKGAVMCMGLRA